MDNAPRLLFSKKEAAQALCISVRTLEYLIGRGELPVKRVGRRVLISRLVLEHFARTPAGSEITDEKAGPDPGEPSRNN